MPPNRFGRKVGLNSRRAFGFGARNNSRGVQRGNIFQDSINLMTRVRGEAQEMSEQQKRYEEYSKLQKEQMEVAKQEEFIQEMEMKKLQKEEMLKRIKMNSKLVEILMKKGMSKGKAIEVAKEMVNLIRELKQQQALTEENYKRLLQNEKLLVEIAENTSKQLNRKELQSALISGATTKSEIAGQILQTTLERYKLIQPQQ